MSDVPKDIEEAVMNEMNMPPRIGNEKVKFIQSVKRDNERITNWFIIMIILVVIMYIAGCNTQVLLTPIESAPSAVKTISTLNIQHSTLNAQ